MVRVTFFNLSQTSQPVDHLIDDEDLVILKKRENELFPGYKWHCFNHVYEEDYANYLKIKYPEIVTIHE